MQPNSQTGESPYSDDGTLVEYVRSFLDHSHFTLRVTAGENGGNHGDR